MTGAWSEGGGCQLQCQEEEAPLDHTTLQVHWQRQGVTLLGHISCKQGYRLSGECLP